MQNVTAFAGQNWLITPAARAVNEPAPGIADQSWLLVLSGVTIPNLKGRSSSDWLHETLVIGPDLSGPLGYAINRFGIQRPPGTEGNNYDVAFALEEWAPFAGLSAVFDQDQSVNAGFAVDVWRPNPFDSGTDLAGRPVNRIFTGIRVDVAVRDSDAWLYRVSYNITLLGKIRFMPHIIF
jgi:hypothetical protein